VKRYALVVNETTAMEQLVSVISLMPSLKSFHLESTRTTVTPNLIAALRDSCPKLSDLRLRSNSFWHYHETLHNSVRFLGMIQQIVGH
jgi:hypothetical protein